MSDMEVKRDNVIIESKSSENEKDIMKLNGLFYKMPQVLSTTVTRNVIKQYSQRQSYSEGDTIIFDLNTGDNYIDPHDCCLKWQVRAVGGTTSWVSVLPGIGSYSLVNEIRIFAKSGVELDRIQDVNQYIHLTQGFTESSDTVDNYYVMAGSGVSVGNDTDVTWSTFVLPLSRLSGLFRPDVKNQKLPPSIISGARIELVLETFARAFDTPDSQNTSYTIQNPQILMTANRLNDLTQRTLNNEASMSGLEYTYPRTFGTTETTDQTSLAIQIKKAVSQAKRIICCPIIATRFNDNNQDSFISIGTDDGTEFCFTDYQYRVGSFYNPQQKSQDAVEHLFITSAGYNHHMDSKDAKSLSLTTYLSDYYAVGASFESNILLNRSGIPINNSNSAELLSTVVNGGNSYKYYLFMDYTSVIKARLTNLSIKI